MKAACFYCKKVTDVDAFSGLCVDCLILRAKEFKAKQVESPPFDAKAAQCGKDE